MNTTSFYAWPEHDDAKNLRAIAVTCAGGAQEDSFLSTLIDPLDQDSRPYAPSTHLAYIHISRS